MISSLILNNRKVLWDNIYKYSCECFLQSKNSQKNDENTCKDPSQEEVDHRENTPKSLDYVENCFQRIELGPYITSEYNYTNDEIKSLNICKKSTNENIIELAESDKRSEKLDSSSCEDILPSKTDSLKAAQRPDTNRVNSSCEDSELSIISENTESSVDTNYSDYDSLVYLDMNHFHTQPKVYQEIKDKIICLNNGQDDQDIREHVVFSECLVLFMIDCSSDFLEKNLNLKIFPKLEKLYCNTDPYRYPVLHRHQENENYVCYLVEEYYNKYENEWWDEDIEHIKRIKQKNIDKEFEKYSIIII